MTDRTQVKAVIDQFFSALNADDASTVPLSRDVEFVGVLQPKPIKGEREVRAHLQDISPFILNARYSRLIIENGAVAALFEFSGVNGVKTQGTYFFDVENSQITRVRSIFDTRPFFNSSNN